MIHPNSIIQAAEQAESATPPSPVANSVGLTAPVLAASAVCCASCAACWVAETVAAIVSSACCALMFWIGVITPPAASSLNSAPSPATPAPRAAAVSPPVAHEARNAQSSRTVHRVRLLMG